MVSSKQKTLEPMLLTKEQVAVMLGMSTRTVRRKAELGEIPKPSKIGHLLRWRRDLIEDWVYRNCPKS